MLIARCRFSFMTALWYLEITQRAKSVHTYHFRFTSTIKSQECIVFFFDCLYNIFLRVIEMKGSVESIAEVEFKQNAWELNIMKITAALCFCASLFYGSLCGASDLLIKDIYPGGSSSQPGNLTNVNGTLFFTASDFNGYGLWKSDGTEAGTVLVKTISATINELTDVNGNLFFTTHDFNLKSTELWVSDGTQAGTILLNSFLEQGSWYFHNLTNANGNLFFTRQDFNLNNTELWVSDGTQAGTVLVKNFQESFRDYGFKSHALFFAMLTDDGEVPSLWKSDGTQEGTVLVKSFPESGGLSKPNLHSLTNFNNFLFFTAIDDTNGQELWKSDGTQEGTVLVKDIRPGPNGSGPSSLIDVNGTLFFSILDAIDGIELWKSDGTQAGTVFIEGLGPACKDELCLTFGGGRYIGLATNVNGRLFFTYSSRIFGAELYVSDGTKKGTGLVKNITEGNSWPVDLTNVNGTLFFVADGLKQLWMSNGTEAGTIPVRDILPEASEITLSLGGAAPGETPYDFANVNNRLFFSASDRLSIGSLGRELYALPRISFADVPLGAFGFEFIETFFTAGITGGCSADNYCPNEGVTRAQMAVFLEKAIQGADFTPPPAVGMFDDVPVTNAFAPWIEQLAGDGITGGCGANNYCPDASVSRAQMAVFIEKALNGSSFTPPAATGMFADVPITNPFAPWVEQLANDNITGGCGGGNFCPNNPVTRAQMAIFLVKAFDLGAMP